MFLVNSVILSRVFIFFIIFLLYQIKIIINHEINYIIRVEQSDYDFFYCNFG